MDLVTPFTKAVICVVPSQCLRKRCENFKRVNISHVTEGLDDGQHVITRSHEKKWSVPFYGNFMGNRMTLSHCRLGQDDAVEVEKVDKIDDANYLFINF